MTIYDEIREEQKTVRDAGMVAPQDWFDRIRLRGFESLGEGLRGKAKRELFRRNMIRVAALAIAAVESMDRKAAK